MVGNRNPHTQITTYLFSWWSGWTWITFGTLKNRITQVFLVQFN